MTAVSDHATGAYSCAAVALGVELAMVRAHDLVESCDQLDLIAAASYDQWQWEPPLVLELEMPSPSVVQLNHMSLAVGMADELDDMTSPSAEEHQMTSVPEPPAQQHTAPSSSARQSPAGLGWHGRIR